MPQAADVEHWRLRASFGLLCELLPLLSGVQAATNAALGRRDAVAADCQ